MTKKTTVQPHTPAPADEHDIRAIKALSAGKASEGQQLIALKWIIEKASRTYDLSYRDDDNGGERASAFAEGKRSVGLQIVRHINGPLPEQPKT